VTRAYVALGANLGDPPRQLDVAVAALDRAPRTCVVARSPRYWTAPVGDADQPDFLNAVVAVDTDLRAHALLSELQRIEGALGRVRDGSRRWGPRVIDLDLLVFGDARIDDEVLTVPHPRIAERGFVLRPLADLAPGLDVPGIGAVNELLARVSTRDMRCAEIGTDDSQ
jgi:2-amino-4-hydroxy-6-hydroxymethyldihydropteridine diphosphokinase